MTLPRPVHIHYRRPPDREDVFHQTLVHDGDDVKITLARDMAFDPPLRIDGEVVLETGSDVVWFTFPGAWHDIGRFHLADDTFTGIYANVLTPPTFHPGDVWRTTDLFLDVWLPAEGDARIPDAMELAGREAHVLDEAQLAEAVDAGWVEEQTARRAREEAVRLVAEAEAGRWPPPVVGDWELETARSAATSQSSSSSSSSTR